MQCGVVCVQWYGVWVLARAWTSGDMLLLYTRYVCVFERVFLMYGIEDLTYC